MASPQKVIGFLHDCLREERSRSGIPNLFAKKIIAHRFLTGTESATTHEFSSLDLPPSISEHLIERANLRGRNSELLYATLPICGKINQKKFCAPLLLYPIAKPYQELRLEFNEVRLNPAIINTFDLSSETCQELLSLIPEGTIGPVTPTLLAKELQRHIPELDITPLDQFPALVPSGTVKKASTGQSLTILPASDLILTDRSSNVVGLLEELSQLSKVVPDKLSSPLLNLLSDEALTQPGSSSANKTHLIPALLSEAQEKLPNSINTSHLSVCQGAPGTGKTFSLAASATEQVLRGHSVLIVCRSEEAADILHQKIQDLVPSSKLIVRAGRRKHLRALRDKVERALGSQSNRQKASQTRPSLAHSLKQIRKAEKQLQHEIDHAINSGELFHSPQDSWWTQLKKRIHIKQLKKKPLLASATELLYRLHHKRLLNARVLNKAYHEKNRNLALSDSKTIHALKTYRDALKRKYVADQEKALHNTDPSALFRIFPVWITTTDDLHRILPFKKGLFDLAIIDEATQCDIPSVLPILHRAKRALISGDPKQLRHLSFLSSQRLLALAKSHGLTEPELDTFNYRETSLIDLALDRVIGTPAFSFLNEHFRSHPDLIRFSNEKFYGGTLHLMRDIDDLKDDSIPLKFIPARGTRTSQGINMVEIEAAVRICQFTTGETTLGFLSPFRAQVDAFLEHLQKTLSPERTRTLIKRQRLIAGTSHSFQGDERDHMIISLALDENSPEGARRFAEREDVFNVAVTRARERMDILHSFSPNSLPEHSLLRSYLQQEMRDPDQSEHSPSLSDLAPTLSAIGWKALPHSTLSGVPIDLLLKKDNRIIAVDLVGTLGEEGLAVSFSKTLLLQRSGIPLYPLRIDEWLHRQNEVVEFFHQI